MIKIIRLVSVVSENGFKFRLINSMKQFYPRNKNINKLFNSIQRISFYRKSAVNKPSCNVICKAQYEQFVLGSGIDPANQLSSYSKGLRSRALII